jgi:hypothetical protein
MTTEKTEVQPATKEELLEMIVAEFEECDAQFSAIRNDWSDPRHECRAGWAASERGRKLVAELKALLAD